MDDFFRHAAHRITLIVGSWQVFLLALLLIAVWAASGPFFGFSDTWQLVINTSTTIVTFLLGLLILLEANRQAKESKVVHDELIRAVRGRARPTHQHRRDDRGRGRPARGEPSAQGLAIERRSSSRSRQASPEPD